MYIKRLEGSEIGLATIALVSNTADTMSFNCFCVPVKTTFNVNGSHDEHHGKVDVLHE